MRRPKTRFALAPLAAVVLMLCALGTGAAAQAAAKRDPARIPLVDQTGTRFDVAALRGRPAVVTFVATRCADACPIANAAFARLAQRLHGDGLHARLLTVTLDPAYDSPFVMARLAQGFGADASVWRLASGSPRDVRALMAALGVVAEPDRNGVPDEHTSFVYVLDSRGRLARTLLLSTNLVDEAVHLLRARDGVR